MKTGRGFLIIIGEGNSFIILQFILRFFLFESSSRNITENPRICLFLFSEISLKNMGNREICGRKRSSDYSPLTLNYNDGLSVLHNGTADAQISTFNCFLIIIINRARSRACRASWLMVVVVGPYPRRRLYNRPVGQRRLVA